MKLEGEQVLFRIFIKVSDKHFKVVPLYRYLIKRIKDSQLAGATVIKSFMGFLGYNSDILREKFFNPSNLPVCIDVVDEPEKINSFLEAEWEHLKNLIITTERARVILYSSDKENRQIPKNDISFIETAKESRRKEVMLKNMSEMVLLRTFIGDSDRERINNKYLYEFIIEEAKKLNFLLAFSYKGIMGYGKNARLRDIETIEFSSNIPICVELIGDDINATKMIEMLSDHIESGLITVEKVSVYHN